MRFLWEQRLVTVGQVSRLLKVGPAVAGRRIAALVALGWVSVEAFPGFEGGWVSLRWGGYRAIGREHSYAEIGTRQLSHIHGMTEARLALRGEFPDGEWVCERELLRECAGLGMVPDGVLKVGDRRLAIEVEMSRKPLADLRDGLRLRCAVYDETWIFAAPRARVRVEEARRGLEDRIVLRDIAALGERSSVPSERRRVLEPDADEVSAIRLISEEGLVAARSLGALLGISEEEGLALGRRIDERNFVRRDFEVDGDGGWLWCTGRAARLSGTGLGPYVPTGAVAVEGREVLARLRVEWSAGPGRRRWIPRRMLLRGLNGPRRADVPVAVVEDGVESRAVLVIDAHLAVWRRRRDLECYSEKFDGVLCVVDESTMSWVRWYVEDRGLENVEIREMP